MLTPEQKAAMRGEKFTCACGYDGPHWQGDPRCAHCGGVRESESHAFNYVDVPDIRPGMTIEDYRRGRAA